MVDRVRYCDRRPVRSFGVVFRGGRQRVRVRSWENATLVCRKTLVMDAGVWTYQTDYQTNESSETLVSCKNLTVETAGARIIIFSSPIWRLIRKSNDQRFCMQEALEKNNTVHTLFAHSL